MSPKLSIAIVCTPGLEFTTRMELEGLGYTGQVAEASGGSGLVELTVDLSALAHLNYCLRTASRVLVRAGEFNAAAFSELRKKASRLPWSQFVRPGQPLAIRVATHASKLYHKKGIAERVTGAVSDAFGVESKLVAGDAAMESGEARLINVRIVRDWCTVSIDSSGANLHRRGYRLEVAKAPLRETIAASLLIAAGWTGGRALVDPFCGSGTIPIEAAMMAAGRWPGERRAFAFEDWPGFERSGWTKPPTRTGVASGRFPPIIGSDRDEGAIRAARANAERAGVQDLIEWKCRSISDLEVPDEGGWVVTNPPYGERVKGGPDLRNLYARIGSVWRNLGPMWHIYMLISSPRWAAQLGMPVVERAKFNNGGIPVRLAEIRNAEDRT